MPMTNKNLITSRELADRWGISARTLEQWRWRGEGPAFIKIGKNIVRYDLRTIEEYENNQTRVQDNENNN